MVGAAACGPTDEIPAIVDEPATAVVLPEPGFHHLHINAVNPTASLDWWQTVWPVGEATEVAGFPAFVADGVYHLYTQVDTSWTMWG